MVHDDPPSVTLRGYDAQSIALAHAGSPKLVPVSVISSPPSKTKSVVNS